MGHQLIDLRTQYSKLQCVVLVVVADANANAGAGADGASCRCGVVDGARVPST